MDGGKTALAEKGYEAGAESAECQSKCSTESIVLDLPEAPIVLALRKNVDTDGPA